MSGGKIGYSGVLPRPPLFHRFREDMPRIYSREELQTSILEEINRLFLSRSAFSLKAMADVDPLLIPYRHPALYGADNVSIADAEGPKFWPQIAEAIQEKIRLYEPRLIDPVVTVQRFDKENQHLQLSISGGVMYGGVLEGMVFEMASPLADVREFGEGI